MGAVRDSHAAHRACRGEEDAGEMRPGPVRARVEARRKGGGKKPWRGAISTAAGAARAAIPFLRLVDERLPDVDLRHLRSRVEVAAENVAVAEGRQRRHAPPDGEEKSELAPNEPAVPAVLNIGG
jgi:hypothetical protein